MNLFATLFASKRPISSHARELAAKQRLAELVDAAYNSPTTREYRERRAAGKLGWQRRRAKAA
jgi:hypothetical protein